MARAVGDRVDEGQALHVLGLVLATEGRTDDAIAHLHEAGQIAVELGDLAEVAGAYVHLWRTLVEAGRGDDLIDLVLAFGTGTTGPSDAPAPTLMGSIGAAALHQLGRWDEAEQLLGDGTAAAEVGGLTAITRTLVAGLGGGRPRRPRPGARRSRDRPRLVPPGGRRAAERPAAPGAGRAGHRGRVARPTPAARSTRASSCWRTPATPSWRPASRPWECGPRLTERRPAPGSVDRRVRRPSAGRPTSCAASRPSPPPRSPATRHPTPRRRRLC